MVAAVGFLDRIGEEGRIKASSVVGLPTEAAPAGAAIGVASTFSGVLAMWKAARSLRRWSRKPFLGAVEGIIELDDGMAADSALGGCRSRLL